MSTPRIRAVDLAVPGFAVVLVLTSIALRRPLPFDGDALRAWGMISLVFALVVVVPRLLDLLPLPPLARAVLGHAVFAAFAFALLGLPSVHTTGDPLVLGIVVLAGFIIYVGGRAHGDFEPAKFLHRWSPFLLAALVYANLASIMPSHPPTIDATLAAIDRVIFGHDLAVWLEPYATWRRDDWFSLHYAIYIAYPVATGLLFYATKRIEGFERLFLRVALALLLGNVCYLIFPAVGPRSFLHFAGALPGGPITTAQAALVDGYGYGYDVFPSLHCAVSLLAVSSLRKPFPHTFRWALFFEANLLASTIWLRMHFAIDLIAGAAFAIAVHYLATAIERATSGPAPGQ